MLSAFQLVSAVDASMGSRCLGYRCICTISLCLCMHVFTVICLPSLAASLVNASGLVPSCSCFTVVTPFLHVCRGGGNH